MTNTRRNIHAQTLQNQVGNDTYVIMKTICTPSHHQNGFVGTQAPGHMVYVMQT